MAFFTYNLLGMILFPAIALLLVLCAIHKTKAWGFPPQAKSVYAPNINLLLCHLQIIKTFIHLVVPNCAQQ